ncbi:hypothetical protein K1W54_08570 [Micromonospora sp. CPCC 205371]|nr:hypothetical protein [Micromonospora sp. CPCC 205371]
MLDASTTAALVTALTHYRTAESASVLAISHDDTLLAHWAHRTLKFNASGTVEPAAGEKTGQTG